MPKYLSALATSSIVGKSDTEGTTINSVLLKQNAVSADSVHTNSLKLASGASSDLWLKCSSSEGDATWSTLPNSFTIAVPTGIAYVATNGNDSTGTGAISAPFATIEHAFSTLSGCTNAVIHVAPGTYVTGSYIFNIDGRNLALIAEGAVSWLGPYAKPFRADSGNCGTVTMIGSSKGCGWTVVTLALEGTIAAYLKDVQIQAGLLAGTDPSPNISVWVQDSTIHSPYIKNGKLIHADNVLFTGELNELFGNLGLMTNCRFQCTLRAEACLDPSEVSPRGFFNCDIRGALTMSGSTAYMDNATYRTLQSNGGSIDSSTQVCIVDAAMTDQVIVDISASPYTIAATTQDAVFVMDTSTANGVIYLPPVSTSTGRVIQIRNTGSKTLCINTSASASADRIWNTLTSVNLRADSSLSLRAGPASQNSWITV